MSVARYVNLSFVAIGILLYVVLGAFFSALLELFGTSTNVAVLGSNFRLGHLLAMLTSTAVAIALRRNERVHAYAMDVCSEIAKVSWPTWKDTKRATIVVIVTTLVIAVILGVLDLLWSTLSKAFYS
jgi:preprotein translocase subunit SecE